MDNFNTVTFLFLDDLGVWAEGVAGGVDTFDNELGTRRRLPVPFGGPGILDVV